LDRSEDDARGHRPASEDAAMRIYYIVKAVVLVAALLLWLNSHH
jgi:hypothetical protein